MAGLRKRLAAQRARRRDANRKLKRFKGLIATQVAFLAQRPRLAAFLAREFNLRFTSGWRSVARNRQVGGVPNSWHTRGTLTKPGAVDLVGAMDDMEAALAWAREHVPNLAEGLIHDVGSGQHLHLGGWGVANWQYPEGGRLKRWRAGRDRQTERAADAERRIAELKTEIAGLAHPAKGIDVSAHQGVVDFEKVKAAGYSFVWVKSSEGQDFIDGMFWRNVKAARAAGLKVGAYHFLRPRVGRSGAVEARWFHEQLKRAELGKGDLIPVLDVESTTLGRDATWRYAREAIDELARLIGRKPLFYTFPAFAGGSWPVDFPGRADLWIAHYTAAAKPTIPRPWQSYSAWQFTSNGSVPGVTGRCDVNRTDNLRALIA